MQRPNILAVTLLTGGMLGLATAQAQTPASTTTQTPAAGSQATPAAKKPAATGTAKTGATTAKTGTAATKTATPLVLKTPKEKASYAIGENIGKAMKKDSVDIDPSILARGIKDAVTGAKPALTDQEAQEALQAFQTEMKAKMEAKAAEAGAANKQAGDSFQAANKTKPGVTTTPTGLQYKVLTPGTGPKPAASDTVICQYRGTLVDGKEFDSSYKRGQPAQFPVTGVIKGWTEALQMMPVGSKWQLVLPPTLAYGDRGAGPDIGPNSTLVFEVELVGIAPKPEAKPDAQAAPKADPAPAKPDAKAEQKPDASGTPTPNKP
ncbi:MAG TPA: FKBP-type peptidyl-prolyl cis-trans isomerase [Candidatus Acidoferrum sp.]